MLVLETRVPRGRAAPRGGVRDRGRARGHGGRRRSWRPWPWPSSPGCGAPRPDLLSSARRPRLLGVRRHSSSRCPCSRPTSRGPAPSGRSRALRALVGDASPAARAAGAPSRDGGGAPRRRRAHAAWTWVPAAMALLHLWAVGYIHAVPFQPAFLAPFLLGLAVTAGREQVGPAGWRCRASPSSSRSGRAPRWASPFPGRASLRLAAPSHPVRRGDRVGLPRVARPRAVAGRARGGQRRRGAPRLGRIGLGGALGRLLRFLGSLLPRDAFGWGLLTVIAAFVLLAAGARRSLEERPRARRVR